MSSADNPEPISTEEPAKSTLYESTDFRITLKEIESKYLTRILSLTQQLELSERKVKNAKYVAQANEALARAANVRLAEAEARASRCNAVLCRVNEVSERDNRLRTISKLQEQVEAAQMERMNCEDEIRECLSDPLLNVPAGTAKRRLLSKLEKRVQNLTLRIQSQSELKVQLEEIDSGFQDFYQAANEGNLAAFTRGLQAGFSVNAVDETGNSVFHYACGRGLIDIANACIEYGADLSDENGRVTPLGLAARHSHVNIVHLLIEAGAEVNGVEESGKTALHLASSSGHKDVVEALIQCGANVRVLDKAGNTPLHEAARHGHVHVAEFLISHGAKSDDRNLESMIALHYAQTTNNRQMQKVLKEGQPSRDIQKQNAEGADNYFVKATVALSSDILRQKKQKPIRTHGTSANKIHQQRGSLS